MDSTSHEGDAELTTCQVPIKDHEHTKGKEHIEDEGASQCSGATAIPGACQVHIKDHEHTEGKDHIGDKSPSLASASQSEVVAARPGKRATMHCSRWCAIELKPAMHPCSGPLVLEEKPVKRPRTMMAVYPFV
eukprot:5626248-Amphidinium_carterae.2